MKQDSVQSSVQFHWNTPHVKTSCWYFSTITCPWHPKTHSSVDESDWLILELNAEHISERISPRCIGAFKVLADRFLCVSVMGEECQESLSPHLPIPPLSQIKTMCPWWPGTWFQPIWGFNSFLHLAPVQTVLHPYSSVYRLNRSLYQSSDRALLPQLLLLNITILLLKITAVSWGQDKRET